MTPEQELRTLFDSFHALALEKGWWENYQSQTGDDLLFGKLTPDQMASKLALVHTEVAEAKGAYWEKWLTAWHRVDGKPEGVGSELADVVIRVADICGFVGVTSRVLAKAESFITGDLFAENIGERGYYGTLCSIGCIDSQVSYVVEAVRVNDEQSIVAMLGGVIRVVQDVAAELPIDLIAALKEKHAYNATRSHKHGGKRI